jgi:hypothetical protein
MPGIQFLGEDGKLRRFTRDLGYLVLATAACAVVWGLLRAIAPTLIVRSAAGLQSLLQVLAAAIVAIFALSLGSIFLLAQHVAAHLGQRSVTALLLERRVRFMLALALLLAVVALLVAGQVPQAQGNRTPAPSHDVTATAGTLAVMTSLFIVVSTVALGQLFETFTSTKKFRERIVADAENDPQGPQELHIKILRQALRVAAQRGDSRDIKEAVTGLDHLVREYIRRHEPTASGASKHEDAASRRACADVAAGALLHGAEAAIRSGAAWRDLDEILKVLRHAVRRASRHGMLAEAEPFVDRMAELVGFSAQLDRKHPVAVGWMPRCVAALVQVERRAEKHAQTPLAVRALAGLAVAMALTSSEERYSQYDWSRLGEDPPYEEARTAARQRRKEEPWKAFPLPASAFEERLERFMRVLEARGEIPAAGNADANGHSGNGTTVGAVAASAAAA